MILNNLLRRETSRYRRFTWNKWVIYLLPQAFLLINMTNKGKQNVHKRNYNSNSKLRPWLIFHASHWINFVFYMINYCLFKYSFSTYKIIPNGGTSCLSKVIITWAICFFVFVKYIFSKNIHSFYMHFYYL